MAADGSWDWGSRHSMIPWMSIASVWSSKGFIKRVNGGQKLHLYILYSSLKFETMFPEVVSTRRLGTLLTERDVI
jgi:hypothetical protein